MTDILDTSEAPLSRTPARFFFETGFFAAYADASIKASNRPPFDLTDAIVDRAWEIAPEAHPDRAEFDRYLSSADSADAQLAEAEATYRAFDEANREADGSREGLRQSATALRRYGAELFPANRAGQVHFARILMDSVASVIDAALAAQLAQGRPVTESCGIAMVEVTDADRAEFERGLITHGFAADTAKELAREQPSNDGALQMLARHRLAHSPGFERFTADRDQFAQIIARAGGGSLCPGLGSPGDYPVSDPDLLAADAIVALASRSALPGFRTRALVIAAREFWDIHNDQSEESEALDKALERFASVVPFANDPANEGEAA